ncbi:MAG: prepilin-type N-terminal cleavage/methylation domain-containing protein [Candidatus Sumerlaeaceae bacterium]|nr:prepilin-type N-terminal cleavage/methylation domain-containing protein [Candidatus Sumerlaeaceae bacterium]
MMNRKPYFTGHQSSGFALIELLLVLIVISILMGSYFSRNNNPNDPRSTYQMSMSKAKDTACVANRAVLRSMIEIYRMNNPGKAVNTENLKAAGNNPPSCPSGGAYGFLADGRILCSVCDAKEFSELKASAAKGGSSAAGGKPHGDGAGSGGPVSKLQQIQNMPQTQLPPP